MTTGMVLLANVLREGTDAIETLRKSGVTRDHFNADEKEVYDFIHGHVKKYGKMPEQRTIEHELNSKRKIQMKGRGKKQYPLIDIDDSNAPDEPIAYWVDKVKEKALHNSLASKINTASKHLRDGDAGKTIKELNLKDIPTTPTYKGVTALKLMTMDFPETVCVVDSILAETGLHVLASKPKNGKSFMVTNFGTAIAGISSKALRRIDVKQGTVIYLALEDPLKRLQNRIMEMSGMHTGKDLRRLICYTEFPRMGQGGLRHLDGLIKHTEGLRLVIIDTLGRFKPAENSKNKTTYDADYQNIAAIKTIADKHEICILLVHHLRKQSAADPFDEISGTYGISGGVDGMLVLKNTRGQADAVLHVRGRDMAERSFALKRHSTGAPWELLGDADDIKTTEKKQQIFDALRCADEPLSPKQIADDTGLNRQHVTVELGRMTAAGEISRISRGKYALQ